MDRIKIKYDKSKDLFKNVKKGQEYYLFLEFGNVKYFKTKSSAKKYTSVLNARLNEYYDVFKQYFKNFLSIYVDMLGVFDSVRINRINENRQNVEYHISKMSWHRSAFDVVRSIHIMYNSLLDCMDGVAVKLYELRYYKALEKNVKIQTFMIEKELKDFNEFIENHKYLKDVNKVKQFNLKIV